MFPVWNEERDRAKESGLVYAHVFIVSETFK